jgi:hypothetical protein
MSIDKKYKKKYKDAIAILKLLNFKDSEINSSLASYEGVQDWEPITLRELKKMSEDELKELKSVCWHEGRLRCTSIGINKLEIIKNKNYYLISFSDDAGDPSFYLNKLTDKMDRCGDFEWTYGLFKKIK